MKAGQINVIIQLVVGSITDSKRGGQRMKRVTILAFAITLCLSGCGSKATESKGTEQVVGNIYCISRR